MYTVVFIDTEVSTERNTVLDYGAAVNGSIHIHTHSEREFRDFLVQNSTGRCHRARGEWNGFALIYFTGVSALQDNRAAALKKEYRKICN